MGHLYLITDGGAIVERRKRSPGRLIEAWPDLYRAGEFWLSEESKLALDAGGDPIQPKLVLASGSVPVYYGPRLVELESLPPEDSLKARVLSAHGIGVVCITVDDAGGRTVHTPESPVDPIFFLRRTGGTSAHVWRLFRTREEAITWVARAFGNDPEALDWASALPAESYEALLERHATPG